MSPKRPQRRFKSNDELKAIINYDPETGVMTWKKKTAYHRTVGAPINSLNDRGYIRFNIFNVSYYAQRIIWFYMTNEWPRGSIDHINGSLTDNRWINLRDVSHATNIQNQRKPRKDNKCGFLGVHKQDDKFIAAIFKDHKTIRLGSYATAELASEAYLNAKRNLHEGCTI